MLLAGLRGFITGAGTGIGRAIALEMVREGADLYITDLDGEAAQRTATEARTLRPEARLYAAALDVRQGAAVAACIEDAQARLGGLELAVNNAGVSSMARVVDLTEDDWNFNMDVNAKGVFLCCQAEVRAMLHRGGGGSIVNIASMAGKKAAPFLAHYSASKFAVVGFTQALALETAEAGIRVNAVCPGYVRTSMQEREVVWEAQLRGITSEEVIADYLRAIPLGRLEEPEDVARVVTFLLSERAAYMTGLAVDVNGGAFMS
ncbi:SDR family NAD(P)-dependent oxidoreductase [Thermogemmatispora tikiterensis]|uniref:3-ketoacyl-ACP reductase n=1 Tax=Thermogemmatispora tikiterensis TaxID=1825093 RepID=A0A328VGR5_9CHLR|nr:SDR family NAD(P)-dependent oxidoreductase [Thermogemmatispora tikiterensis]RAQ94354.1 3-ketoacyl-ACP reductase [Thermogemmatispora tikiterensis]